MTSQRDNPYCSGELAQQAAAHLQASDPAADPASGQPAADPGASEVPEFEALSQERDALKDQLLRQAADFDNSNKRQAREKEEQRRFADERLLLQLLPVIDNLERAVAHSAPTGEAGGETAPDPIIAGVRMVLKQFHDFLTSRQVVAFASHGMPFDPVRHEAIGQEASATLPPNTVVHQVQQGYTLHDRLLRPARVVVSMQPASPASAGW